MASIKILGGLNRFYGIPTSPSDSVMAQNLQLFSPREGFLTHQWIIKGNKKKITDKYYDETKDEDSTETTCCDRHLEIPGVSNNTTGTLEQKKTNS